MPALFYVTSGSIGGTAFWQRLAGWIAAISGGAMTEVARMMAVDSAAHRT
ncbi:MAG TPA: hypothetical protein VMT00_06620 [Thermoanaerobaculia bacterium]|nr:hypothetical protein [Thermoanaerobaculia bacterium]